MTTISANDRLSAMNGEIAPAAQLAEAVVEASAALSGKSDPQQIHDTIVQQAARLLGADIALLHGARSPTELAHPARLLASSGLPNATAGALDDLTSTPSLALRAAESGRIEHTAADPAAIERLADVRAIDACLRPCWVLAAPLLGAERLLGVLTCAFGDRSPPRSPPPHEVIPRAQALGALFALALGSAAHQGEPRVERAVALGALDALDDADPASSLAQQRAEALLRDAQIARREAEDRLAAEQHWLRSIIKDFPVAIAVFDERGSHSLVASRRCEQLCAGPHPLTTSVSGQRTRLCELTGRPLSHHEMPLVRAARGEGTICAELCLRRPDGSNIPVVVSAGPIRDEQGAILGAIASYEDVTHFMERERLREEWLSIVAHDLKQPLTAIAASAGMLSRRSQDAGIRAWSGKILASVQRLERMTEDLLDASKLEAQRFSLERRPTDLCALLHAAVELAAAERPERAVVLTADEDVPPVHVDAARMDQVIGNLLLNAAKYGDPGAPIRVALSRRDAEIEVAIENRGPGISPDELPRLFQRFQRLSADPSRSRPPGTGLGLYICKGIIEAHGGRIWAQSQPDETTSFHFALPLTETPSGRG
ncbi:ATP-binding protein [Sorangium sp. So ce1000]|uniref:sensor histidine kinase n=1 Tax=Sorangium sp. So ce1000 TaxID=3133325 RepID=UPI003F5FBE52